ncbi:VWA domain-containing protein [Candidatus Bipolaricaulota bacterium]|nr:VWA domain-containing protein [Candidatus Bipolaricaulota bacterium]
MRLLAPWALAGLLPALAVAALSLRRRALVGRAITLALLTLALAGPEVALRRTGETVIFLVDRSASVGEEAASTLSDLAASVLARGGEVGAIEFADGAEVRRWPSVGEIPSGGAVRPVGTDVGAAVDLALALAPDGPTQIVLLSDGRATSGDALAAASRARSRGIPVHVRPVARSDLVRVAEFRGPAEAPVGVITLDVAIEASDPTAAEVRLYRGDEEIRTVAIDLLPGTTRLSFTDRPPAVGFNAYRVEASAAGDGIAENNALSWGVVVGETAAVLVVGPAPSAVDDLLAAAQVPFHRRTSLAPEDLAGVGLVILDDHPLGLLGPRTLTALRSYVAGGGGLLVVQGRRAVAGYLGPVEEILPVTYTVPERIQEATAAVVFVLDRSASMSGMAEGVVKIDLLKEAAAAAVEVMPWEDVVGAIAFDRWPHWLVRPGPVSEVREALFAALRGLTASGGTDVFPALAAAVEALLPLDVRVRHAIVISDGKTVVDEEILAGLRSAVPEAGIGITTIAIGADADMEVLRELSALGGGRSYVLASMGDLRAVLVQETERVARPRFIEAATPVLPGPGAAAFPLSGALPPLAGYTLTFPKPTADVAFLSPAGDPLLARWQLGLGQVAVVNADLSGVWTRHWLASAQLGELWGTLLGLLWGERQAVRVDWEVCGATLRLGVEASEGGRWVNGLALSGELVGPGGLWPLSFDQVAPGRYEASLPTPGSGVYVLTVADPSGRYGGTFPVALPYPAELVAFGPDHEALHQIARLSEGEVVRDEILPPPPGAGRDWLPIGRAFLWAAACCFLLDLGLRKLLV